MELEPFSIPTKVNTSSNVHQSHYSQYPQGHQANSGYNPIPNANQRPVSSTYGGAYNSYGQGGSTYHTGGGYPYTSQRYWWKNQFFVRK